MSSKLPALFLLLTLPLFWIGTPSGKAQTTAPATSHTVQAFRQFQAALVKIGQSQPATRQAGRAALRHALADIVARLIRARGPERQARIAHLLRDQGDLARWAGALLHLPLQQRIQMLRWGLTPKRLPLVAGAFSHNQQRRANVAHPLAKIPGPNADWLLNHLLNDPHRLVYLTTMDALWNRPPTPAMVKALWHRAVILTTPFTAEQNAEHLAVFRGRRIAIFVNSNSTNYWVQMQYSVYAMELLEHWKPKGLGQLAAHALLQICRQPPMQNIFNTPYTAGAKNFAKLLLHAKPATVEPYLLFLIHHPIIQNFVFMLNNKPGHFSNRTLPLYLLIKFAGKNPAAYHLQHTPAYGGVWATGTVQQEDAAIKEITALYAKRKITAVTQSQLQHPAEPHGKP